MIGFTENSPMQEYTGTPADTDSREEQTEFLIDLEDFYDLLMEQQEQM